MFAVVVTFEIKPLAMADFQPAMEENAQRSLEKEAGCHQFDVCTDPSRPNEVFLYELYTDAAAFAVHLKSDHYQAFDKVVSPMISSKKVKTFERVVS